MMPDTQICAASMSERQKTTKQTGGTNPSMQRLLASEGMHSLVVCKSELRLQEIRHFPLDPRTCPVKQELVVKNKLVTQIHT